MFQSATRWQRKDRVTWLRSSAHLAQTLSPHARTSATPRQAVR